MVSLSKETQPKMDGTESLQKRSEIIFRATLHHLHRHTDLMFAALMPAQWLFCLFLALWLSPFTYEGSQRSVHLHVWAALFFGGLLTAMPVYLALAHGGRPFTRHTVAVAQALMSSLIIHLTGGRIESHFHVFGSLAFLAFYRDWPVLITATVIVTADHAFRGVFYPQSVYGVLTPDLMRTLEHAGWVVFEDCFLFYSCITTVNYLQENARRQAELEALNARVEQIVEERTAELQQTQGQLAQAQRLESLGKLASGIAHDFNNVLGGILAYASLLKLGRNGDEQLAEGLNVIETSAQRGAELTAKMLAFARKGNYEKKVFSLAQVTEEAVSLVKVSLPDTIQIQVQLPPELAAIEGDSTQVLQVVMNLLVNAKDAMPEGGSIFVTAENHQVGEVCSVTKGSLKAGSYLRLRVKDSGQGIPKEIQEKVFEPFFTTKAPGKGTGLGLSMVYGIVQSHGGTVTLQSEPGRGTCFDLYFPAVQAAAAGRDGSAFGTLPSANYAEALRGLRVLVADDELALRKAARELLASCGADVTLAADGEEAVAAYNAGQYDVVVLDSQMPRLDGMAAFRQMQTQGGGSVFVIASGYTESDEIAALRNQYGVLFVPKPYSLGTLVGEILRGIQVRKAA